MRTHKRLRPNERIKQLATIAASEIDFQGHLPIHHTKLAEKAGVTPSLIYNYFQNEDELYTEIVKLHINELYINLKHSNRISEYVEQYFEFLISHGRAMAIILSDPHKCRHLPRDTRNQLASILRKVIRLVRRETKANLRKCILFVLSATAVPEEFLHLHNTGKLSRKSARKYSIEMIEKGIVTLSN